MEIVGQLFSAGKGRKKQKKIPTIWWVHIGGIWVVKRIFLKAISCAYLMEFGSNIGYFIHNHPFSFLRRFLRAINILSH